MIKLCKKKKMKMIFLIYFRYSTKTLFFIWIFSELENINNMQIQYAYLSYSTDNLVKLVPAIW